MDSNAISKQSKVQLIPYTDKNQVLTDSKESFESFMDVYSQCGGKVNDTTIKLIKASIDKNRYTVKEIETAVIECFEQEQFFNWANIVKHIKRANANYMPLV